MKKIIALVIVVVLLSIELVAGIASADDSTSQLGKSKEISLDSMDMSMASDGMDLAMKLDGSWVILDQNMLEGDFFSGGPWIWDSPSKPVKLTITDLYVVSDQFVVYDYGVPVVTTPFLPNWDILGYENAFTSPPWTNNPNTALASNFFSSAIIVFPPGAHSITIKDIYIPPRITDGRPCSDGTVAFKAEQVDNTGVSIDIKPCSNINAINLSSNGVIPVAILGNATFDVTSVDVSSLEFGPLKAKPFHDLTNPLIYAEHLQDVNSDGFVDLISHYKTKETGILPVADTAILFGNLLDGTLVQGMDSVRIVKA